MTALMTYSSATGDIGLLKKNYEETSIVKLVEILSTRAIMAV